MIDKEYLIKLKASGGLSDDKIARRLGCTVAEVEEEWLKICNVVLAAQKSGYPELQQQFLILGNQYQLMGESLKAIGNGLGNICQPDELRQLLNGIAVGTTLEIEKVVELLISEVIVLKPYVAIDPLKSLEETQAAKLN